MKKELSKCCGSNMQQVNTGNGFIYACNGCLKKCEPQSDSPLESNLETEKWKNIFDNDFKNCYQFRISETYRAKIKSFISNLLQKEREQVVLKGERNRIISQIRAKLLSTLKEKIKEKGLHLGYANPILDIINQLTLPKEK